MNFELQPGQVIDGKYEIREKIGQGGMGAVYRVHHKVMQRDQALKLIQTSDLGDDEAWEVDQEELIADMLARFMRETQTLARFAHPNIITAYDAGAIEVELILQGSPKVMQVPYLVMEYFDGGDGKRWALREQPTAARVLEVAKQLASGLACAHDAGVLHRDLKPQNVLISKDDRVKIVDFGLAKPEGGGADLTRTKSSLAGTLAYLAPEYAGGAAGPRVHTQATDLWALGCCLYFFLTHRGVFVQGRDEEDWRLLARVSRGEFEPIDRIRSDLSADFVAVIKSLLNPDPKQRLSSARELIAQLSRIARADDPTKPAYVPPSKKAPPPPPSGTDLFSAAAAPAPAVKIRVSSITPAPPKPAAGILDDLPTQGAATAAMRPSKDVSGSSGENVFGADDVSAMNRALATADTAAKRKAPDASMASMKSPRAESPGAPGEATMLRAMEAALEGGVAAPVAKAAAQTQSQPSSQPSPTSAAAARAPTHDAVEDDPATPSMASVRLPPPTFQPAQQASSTAKEKKAKSALFIPAAAVSVVGLIGAFTLMSAGGGEKTPVTDVATASANEQKVRAEEKARAAAEAEAKATEAERRRMASEERERQAMLAAALANPQPPAPPAPSAVEAVTHPQDAPPPASTPPTPPKPGRVAATGSQEPSPSSSPPAPAANDPWARFGSRDVNTGASSTTASATTAGAGASTAGRRQGVRIPVRVAAEMVSSPAGPVIATVTQATSLGDVNLPVGTEIHGQIAGAQGTRVMVNFTMAIVNGTNISLAGSALGLDGKAGVAGVRAGADGTDIAAAAASSAVSAVGSGVAAALGNNPGGAAVQGGTGAASQNTQRLNTTQDIVTAKKGARFSVYVTR